MVEHKKEKSFKKNALIALLAQTVSLGVSFIMSMVIPRYMDVASYGYWQLFIFYTPYSVITHLGIVDGIYLRELGKRYENLNFPSLGMQFRFLTVEQAVIAVGMILGAKYLVQGDRQFVFVMTGIYMVLFNLIYYIGYIFQATNHTYLFSNTI